MNVHRDGAVRLPRNRYERRNGPVEVVKVDARVMKEALRLADGDASRLKIVNARTVEVR